MNHTALRLLLVIVTLLMPLEAFAKWETVNVRGTPYVTLNSIKTFYKFSRYSREGKSGILTNSAVKMQVTINSQECFMNRVKFILTNPVVEHSGRMLVSQIDLSKLIDPVLRPSYIGRAGNFTTVVLDPGHGGKDAGARNQYGRESTYNLNVARKVRDILTAQGFKVIMTRESDRYLTLQQRVNIANRYRNAIFISIHFNAGGRRKARGIETFTLSPQGVAHYGRSVRASDHKLQNGNYHDSANIALATAIHGRTLQQTKSVKIPDRGIKRARYSVLTSVKHPAILLEGGFMSHPVEARIIHSPSYQYRVARGIAEGIMRYQAAVRR
ncbi:N-acetylmuramoyl-L-alanine amidase family protein [Rubritalea marina]|uniref:N-acetylmuramoyl-L-alanine amidase family protein n=1 Tax=Rubritalea marina TaxID=361055 RepID=UPI00037082A0|nr:N-acetylmuramoyl-L-alanine amidase [Rubritalea marina]